MLTDNSTEKQARTSVAERQELKTPLTLHNHIKEHTKDEEEKKKTPLTMSD